MIVYKKPKFRDDSYYFVLEPEDNLANVEDDEYLQTKRRAFSNKDISKEQFEAFNHRPSLSRMDLVQDLSGTIYTHSAEVKSWMELKYMLYHVQILKDKSRRCVIRLADSFEHYMNDRINTSCLNIIHYMGDNVKLFFRASDMKNELLYDILLIEEFFIAPVYSNKPHIHIISSTAQNIIDLNTLIK